MRVRNIDQDPDSLHQRIIADDDLGFTQAIIAQRQGCAQSTVSQVLAAERLRRLRAELGKDADGADGPETSVRAVHAAEQVREALAYVRAVEKRLMAIKELWKFSLQNCTNAFHFSVEVIIWSKKQKSL